MQTPGSIYVAKKSVLLTNPTAATVFLQADNAAKAASVFVPDMWQDASSLVTGQQIGSVTLLVKASGRVTGGTTTNFTPVIQLGSSITAASNTAVASATARAVNSTSSNWYIEAQFIWDFTSKRLGGAFWAVNGSAQTLDAQATVTAQTAIDWTTSGNGFSVSALFSATNAGNLAYLDGLTLEVV